MSEASDRVRFYLDHRWAPGRFSAQLDGELRAPQRGRMERHLRECVECRRAFAGLSAVVEALRRLQPPQPARTPAQLVASVLVRFDGPPNRAS
jgi:anti-sigma factor RsiW